jgi:PAS domain S-box-containing protein
MPPLFWLDIIAYSISTVVAASLVLLAVGFGPKCTINLSLALFALMEVLQAVLAIFLRMALWLEIGDPSLLLELETLAAIVMGPCLLIFAVRYLHRHTRWADSVASTGLLVMAVFCVPLFRHQLVFAPRLDIGGITVADISIGGLALSLLPVLYMIWSLVLFWQERHRVGELYLVLSVLILLLGFVISKLLFVRFPVTSVATALGFSILGYGVVSRQTFNPLWEQTVEFRREVVDRQRAEEGQRKALATREDTLADEVSQATHALRESEEQYRQSVENSPNPIFSVNRDGLIQTWNPACEKIFRYGQDMIGQHYGKLLLNPEDRPIIESRVSRVFQERLLGDLDMYYRCQDGTERIMISRLYSLLDGAGRVQSCVFANTDITERVRAEEALIESEERYRTLVTQAPVGVVTGDCAGNITHVNPAALQILGSSSEEAARQFNLLTMSNLVDAGITDDVRRCIEEAAQITAEYSYCSHWGSEIILRLHMAPLRDEIRRISGVLILLEDVTVQRQLEEQLVQSAKLASIGELAAGVAHEINNPINGIINYAQLLLNRLQSTNGDGLGHPDTLWARKWLEGIMRESDRVADIVRDLLTFARVDKAAYSLAHVPHILQTTLVLVEQQLRKDSIVLEIIEEQLHIPQIRCRSQRVQQVFLNLISNACDALNARYPESDPNKRLVIHIGQVEKDGQSYVRTTFQDFGVGIPVRNHAHIFTPFFTTKRPGEGTGLGLSVSYGIVQDHHGDIQVESVEGEYTIFRVDLPAVPMDERT